MAGYNGGLKGGSAGKGLLVIETAVIISLRSREARRMAAGHRRKPFEGVETMSLCFSVVGRERSPPVSQTPIRIRDPILGPDPRGRVPGVGRVTCTQRVLTAPGEKKKKCALIPGFFRSRANQRNRPDSLRLDDPARPSGAGIHRLTSRTPLFGRGRDKRRKTRQHTLHCHGATSSR